MMCCIILVSKHEWMEEKAVTFHSKGSLKFGYSFSISSGIV